MKRRLDGTNIIDSINNLPSDILRSIFSFCKGSCANLTCKRWNDLYFQVYKKNAYNLETLKNEKLMLYLITSINISNVSEGGRYLLFRLVSLYSSLEVVKTLYKLNFIEKGSDDLFDISSAIINSLDMTKIYWYFVEEEISDLKKEFSEYDSSIDHSPIETVIETENLMILDFLDLHKFDFTYYDIEYAVSKGKLVALKHMLGFGDGPYNLEKAWSLTIAAKNKHYLIIDFLISIDYNLFNIKEGVGRSEVQDASYFLGKNPDMDMVKYLISKNHFDPISFIIGILAFGENIEFIYQVKILMSLDNIGIIEAMAFHPLKKDNSISEFRLIFDL